MQSALTGVIGVLAGFFRIATNPSFAKENAYLTELVRYIHLNPLRARIVPDVDELNGYDSCGHSALMGVKKRPWQDVDDVLQERRCFKQGQSED